MRTILARLGASLLLIPSVAFAQSSIRFGVLGLFHPRALELAWTGPGALLVSGSGDPIVLNGERAHRSVAVQAADGKLLLAGHATDRITATSRGGHPASLEVIVPGRFRRVYHGNLEITARGNELIVVVGIEIELAVATIVASEMPLDTPLEALKAQAVVTRSFLSAGARHRDFDFCDTTHCQYMRSPTEVSSRVWSAVRATQRMILTWRNKPIAALYSSRCGGSTRSLRQAGIDPGDGYPFYAVECRWCRAHPMQEHQHNTPPHREWGALTIPHMKGYPTSAENNRAGLGHGIGMCQHGAAGMALAGADFNSILTHYYPNTDLTMLP
jgi:hypothetical protein